jgi:hypothetical protein
MYLGFEGHCSRRDLMSRLPTHQKLDNWFVILSELCRNEIELFVPVEMRSTGTFGALAKLCQRPSRSSRPNLKSVRAPWPADIQTPMSLPRGGSVQHYRTGNIQFSAFVFSKFSSPYPILQMSWARRLATKAVFSVSPLVQGATSIRLQIWSSPSRHEIRTGS